MAGFMRLSHASAQVKSDHDRADASHEALCLLKDEDQEDLTTCRMCPRCSTKNRRLFLLCIINIVIMLVTMLLVATSIFHWKGSIPSINAAIQLTTGYSPILDSIDVKLKSVYLNGTLFPPKNEPWSRKEPGNEEAEAMWSTFEPATVFPITRDDVIRMGKDPKTAVRFPDEHFGLGDEAYVGALDVTHKLHCLNELRKMTFAKYPTSNGDNFVHFTEKEHETYYHRDHHGPLWWYHLRHCLDILTQDLICHADAHVHTYNFRDTQVHPFPDFSIKRECRDLDQILEYRKVHQVDQDKYIDTVRYEEGKTAKLLPLDKQFYESYGFAGSVLFPDGEGFEEYWAEHWV